EAAEDDDLVNRAFVDGLVGNRGFLGGLGLLREGDGRRHERRGRQEQAGQGGMQGFHEVALSESSRASWEGRDGRGGGEAAPAADQQAAPPGRPQVQPAYQVSWALRTAPM